MSAARSAEREGAAVLTAIRRAWRSIGFRLAFYYGLLVSITMLCALAILHLQTVGVMQQRMARHVATSMQQLMHTLQQGGEQAVAREIARILADGRDSDNEIYLLLDARQERLAGNLDQVPPRGLTDGAGVLQTRVQRAGNSITAYLMLRTLPQGGLLIVGQDLRDQESLESLVGSASLAAGIVAVLLLLGGTFVFRQELERSVGEVRRTAARIAEGNLRERVHLSAQDDEFGRLEHDINAMLDRIEALMDGVRHVSDSIAHNLRTPLSRILMRLRAASAADVGESARQEALARSIHDIEELTAVFEKLLQIAEAEAGTRRRQFGAIALHEIAIDVVDLYEPVAEARGVALSDAGVEHAIALGDRDLVASAVANLVDNALKYAGMGATVQVQCRLRDDGGAEIVVQDNGPGIPAEARERVGTRFFRLVHDQPGHGLGLASVRAIASLHGGSLVLEDVQPGLRARLLLPGVPGR